MNSFRPISLHIDGCALRHNFEVVKKNVGKSKVYAVIKANAYGCDDAFVLDVLHPFADGFALLELPRALFLREKTNKPLLLLEGVFDKTEAIEAAKANITMLCHNLEQLSWAMDAAKKVEQIQLVLKFNTGMNRLGLTLKTLPKALSFIQKIPNAHWILMTHFAKADEPNGCNAALATFQTMRHFAIQHVPFLKNAPVSLANSAAILSQRNTHAHIVRPGIMLYGASPFGVKPSAKSLDLKPVLSLKSKIIAIQHLEKGAQVGYGGNFVAPETMPIGIVACGYADGYPKIAHNAPVLIDQQKSHTIGNVAMDMLCVDLRQIKKAQLGQEVELFGETIPADEVAQSANTIAYEIFCAIAPRVPRIFKN